jgi:hypothetical protein
MTDAEVAELRQRLAMLAQSHVQDNYKKILGSDGVDGLADTEDDSGVCYALEVALKIQVEVRIFGRTAYRSNRPFDRIRWLQSPSRFTYALTGPLWRPDPSRLIAIRSAQEPSLRLTRV